MVALERGEKLSVHVHGGFRLLKGTGERNSEVRVLRFTRTVHHASHNGNVHCLDTGACGLPHRHLFAKVGLDILGHVLEERRRRTPAPGARGDLRRKAP